MTIESGSAWPPRNEDPMLSAGMDIARQWGQLSPDHLKLALEALEPQMRREHQLRIKQLDFQAKKAEQEAKSERDRRRHQFKMASLIVGAVLAAAMLGGGVYVAKDNWWLATLLCGPSLIALAKIVFLRRSDPDDMKLVAAASKHSTNAASQTQPPP
ncbi:hypothetical protein ACIRU2_15880 [Streptomyces sp. NPDC101169]|uniref:hypothetical protein n=1 Tax=Streptomyces sp. NPDC101169 TaxID=3366121 RepID=UPI003811B540